MHYESVGIPLPPPHIGVALKILRSPLYKIDVAPGVLRGVLTARFDYVFDTLVHSITKTKFGRIRRSKANGSYLWVPQAL